MDDPSSQLVIIGKISSAYGIKGWVNISSYTQPVTNILNYQPWYLQSRDKSQSLQAVRITQGRLHGKHVVAQIEGISDRNQAELMRGLDIAIKRDQLPEPEPGEYYWVDLEGLTVVTVEGIELGTVHALLETGANDVLVVSGDKERLIPYVLDEVIQQIDLDQRKIIVNWDPEF